MRASSPVVLLVLLAACTAPESQEIEIQRGKSLTTPRPEPEAQPAQDELEETTLGLLERLLSEEGLATPPAIDPESDTRPLCLDLGFVAGLGPFRAGGHELPLSAAEAALSDGLVARFARGGPLRGPVAISWEDLFDLDDPDVPVVIEPPLAPDVRARALALGGDYLLLGRLERLEHRRVSVFLPAEERFESRERGHVRLWFHAYEVESGALVCTELLDRRYELDELSTEELASVERVLAEQAALLVRDALEACLETAQSAGDDQDPDTEEVGE